MWKVHPARTAAEFVNPNSVICRLGRSTKSREITALAHVDLFLLGKSRALKGRAVAISPLNATWRRRRHSCPSSSPRRCDCSLLLTSIKANLERAVCPARSKLSRRFCRGASLLLGLSPRPREMSARYRLFVGLKLKSIASTLFNRFRINKFFFACG